MADDRPDLSASDPRDGEDDDFAWAAPEDQDALRRALPPITPEWEAENIGWVRAMVQEALDDPRPALTSEEVRASLEAHARELFEKYGR